MTDQIIIYVKASEVMYSTIWNVKNIRKSDTREQATLYWSVPIIQVAHSSNSEEDISQKFLDSSSFWK